MFCCLFNVTIEMKKLSKKNTRWIYKIAKKNLSLVHNKFFVIRFRPHHHGGLVWKTANNILNPFNTLFLFLFCIICVTSSPRIKERNGKYPENKRIIDEKSIDLFSISTSTFDAKLKKEILPILFLLSVIF